LFRKKKKRSQPCNKKTNIFWEKKGRGRREVEEEEEEDEEEEENVIFI
jgi:hypothetical protein